MAGPGEGGSGAIPEGVAISSGDSSVEKPVSAVDTDARTLPGVAASDVTLPGNAPNLARRASTSPAESVNSSDAITIAGRVSSRPSSESSSVFRSIGATIFSEGDILGGRYQITKLLGMGGMGAVYKAHDMEVERSVGLKVIRPELAGNPAILARFKQELILARQVTDKNIIRIYDLNDADGVKFITMEFIEGEDLRSILTRQGKLPPEEAVEIMHQVCAGLRAAHLEGVIHRDLKPSNIMRNPAGRVVIMDFGLARDVQGDGMTQTGMMIGTMEYMSPEQANGLEVDATSDIYAVGLIAYEMLTGKMPYAADSAVASLLKRSQERAKPMIDVDSSIPRDLSNIVARCIEPDRKKRYQNTAELIADLEDCQQKGAASTLRFPDVRAWARDIPWPLIGVITSVLVLAVFGFLLRNKLLRPKISAAPAPVSVLVADFQNKTADPLFDDTLEPMFNVALEGASFINTYNRGNARNLAGKLPNPTNKLDENTARLVAINQGVAGIVTGSLSKHGNGYELSVKAVDAVSGKTLASDDLTADNKDDLFLDIPKAAARVRKALGDTTPQSVQVEKLAGAFSSSSLEAVHQYAIADEQMSAGNSEEALRLLSNAIALDPNFARAYAGMSAVYINLGKTQDAEKYAKLAMEHVDRMTERERYRVRGFYYFATSNYPKCIEEYGELVKRFPADNVAWLNLAPCYLGLRRIPEAVAAAQRAVEIVPKGALQRVALSFYSSYGGDFAVGEREARTALKLNPSSQAYLALAEAQLGLGQMAQAAETYHKMEKVDALGASLAASGLADIASYEGRYADAVRILDQGVTADLAAKNEDSAAEKLAGISRLQLLRGQKGPAVAAATKALSMSQSVPVRVLAAQSLLEAGELAKAEKLADGLASEVSPETQAYAKIIRGDLALQRGQNNEAIKMFTDGNQLVDTWIGRFDLGRAYLEAGMFVEADSEFDRCMKRRGEALEIFQDNVPTFAYFPPLYYYQGRVREGLKSPGFAEPYRMYLDIRGHAGEDPLLADIRRRLK